MPQRTLRYLQNPFKYPEWGEMLLSLLGLLQFVFAVTALWSPDANLDPVSRPALTLTVYFSPQAWGIAGLFLCIMHLSFISMSNEGWRYKVRLIAAASSLAFWTHFILSVLVFSAFFGGPVPSSLVPALGTPLLSGAVLYRLWRRY